MAMPALSSALGLPASVDALRRYDARTFRHDAIAGVTVGLVALPLAMAFAIASGLRPQAGIYCAIVTGFLISVLGGSRVQIGGPTGAFVVVVSGIVAQYGVSGLFMCTMMAGVMLILLGLTRSGNAVRFIPRPVVIGFTNGIAVLIALSQLRDLFGLRIEQMPADFFSQIATLWAHLDSFNLYAFAIGMACFGGLFLWPQLFKSGVLPEHILEDRAMRTASRIPGPVIALITMTALVALLEVPVETIGTRFGGIPQALPNLTLPPFSWASAKELLFPILTITMLGAIESLLCARVADNLTELPRHDPNQELMAQGVANFVSPFFGGIPATGTIARTVTNVRAGATSPVAGIVHAVTLLAIVLAAAPLAVHVPLAALAGILLFVAWNMGEWHEFVRLKRFAMTYRIILLATFFLTVVMDLTIAMQVGLVLACAFFIYRMNTLSRVEALPAVAPDVEAHRLIGVLFFGSINKLEPLIDPLRFQGPQPPRAVILECNQLLALDTTAVEALDALRRQLVRIQGQLIVSGANGQPLSLLQRSGFVEREAVAPLAADLATAVAAARAPAVAPS
jgi:sulfate permease, SulP family